MPFDLLCHLPLWVTTFCPVVEMRNFSALKGVNEARSCMGPNRDCRIVTVAGALCLSLVFAHGAFAQQGISIH